MTAEYPSVNHIPALRRVWKEAFGDTDVFLDGFFAHGFSPRRCRCITEDDAVLSALYWFEATCHGQKFAYLYAVATAASHRGRGLFGALLIDTVQVLTMEGFDGILLVPEDEPLRRMYEKFGFSACTTVDCHSVPAGKEPVPLREIGPEEFARLRRGLLPQDGILQEGEILRFLASQYRFWTGDGWLAVGQVYDDQLVCQEFLGEEAAMAGLVRAADASAGEFRTPGNTEPFAWFLPLHGGCERPGYFALALD